MTRERTTPQASDLLDAMEQSFNAVMMTDAEPGPHGPRILYVNPAFCRMSGYTEEELLGRTPRILQGPATNPDVLARLRDCLRDGTFFSGSTVNYRKDGSPFDVEWNISPIRDETGRVVRFLSIHQDISGLVAEQETSRLYSNVLNNLADGVIITDAEGHIEYANASFQAITGYTALELLGRKPPELHVNGGDASIYQTLHQTLAAGRAFHTSFTYRHKTGRQVHCDEAITPMRHPSGKITHYISIVRDLTERVEELESLRQMAWNDGLTGAMTRAAGVLQLEKAYTQARMKKAALTLALVDVDHFKKINDTWGHTTGDKALQEVVRHLTAVLRASDSIIRWGGEEFLLIFSGCDAATGGRLAERCRLAVNTGASATLDLPVTVSMGVGQLEPEETAHELIERVDQALYDAKHGGGNRVCMAAPRVSRPAPAASQT